MTLTKSKVKNELEDVNGKKEGGICTLPCRQNNPCTSLLFLLVRRNSPFTLNFPPYTVVVFVTWVYCLYPEV